MRRLALAMVASVMAFAACGSPQGAAPGGEASFAAEAEIPQLEGQAQGGADEGAAAGLGEEAIDVAEATPEGLHIARFTISPLSPDLRDAINFTGFHSGGTSGLIELPVAGLNERQKIYFLLVPVINEGKAPVRNLKGRAEFFDAQGRRVWEETLALTHPGEHLVRRRLAILAALALLGAACSSSADTAQGGPEPGPTGSGGTPQPDVVVGMLYTVGGQGGEFAQAALGVADLVVEDAQDAGIDLGIESADYEGEPKKALGMARDLVERGAAGIVVASDDPALAEALRGFDDVPLVYALASDDAAVSADTPVFRLAPSNELQARKIAEFLVDHRGYEKIAILHDNSDFGKEGAADLESELSFGGADVVLNAEFKPGGDVHTSVSHAGQLGAQALVVWSRSSAEAGRITIDVHKSTQSYQLVLSGNLATASYGKNASSQVVPVAFRDGILSVGTWAGPWFDEVPS
ncbi:MAG: ABC transporter substrate-binding protein, partial [Actinobacteria bacterium]|nr:ABC transporter substrate-binding protein [Actinomycetota bacterium]